MMDKRENNYNKREHFDDMIKYLFPFKHISEFEYSVRTK